MPQRAGLPEHGVDESRLAMVDVSDDRDVSKVGARIHVPDSRSAGNQSRKRRREQSISSKYADLKAKKKCCRSKPRCKKCPLVLHKVRKAELVGIHGKDLDKVYKRARKA
jgi:hypothetical protein